MAAARPNRREVPDLRMGVSLVRSTSGSPAGPGRGSWSSCMGCSSPRPQGRRGRLGWVPVKRRAPRGASAAIEYPFAAARTLDAAMGALAIEVHDLHMRYGAEEAVRGIDLEVGRGEVFGFLGPNGAGKTTTIEILEGYRPRTSG